MAAMKISVIFRLLLIAVCHRDTTEQSGAAEEEGPCPTDDPTINFLSLLPCTNTTDSANSTAIVETCDVFIYPAMLLAIEHINSNQDVLKYPEYNFNDTLRMIESETKVISMRTICTSNSGSKAVRQCNCMSSECSFAFYKCNCSQLHEKLWDSMLIMYIPLGWLQLVCNLGNNCTLGLGCKGKCTIYMYQHLPCC